MRSWTEIYSAISLSTAKYAPALNRELRESCDLKLIQGNERYDGFFDGPRAWRMCKLKAVPPAAMRTKRDKDYYDSARNLQKQRRLPNHCSVQEFQKRALNFIVHINPYLAQPYSNQDAAEYVVDLMPECLDTDGRILKKSLLNSLRVTRPWRRCSKMRPYWLLSSSPLTDSL